jgi:hypothetical protein
MKPYQPYHFEHVREGGQLIQGARFIPFACSDSEKAIDEEQNPCPHSCEPTPPYQLLEKNIGTHLKLAHPF